MGERHKLDTIDLKILAELQRNGRITNVELAEIVNLSPSPCLMRVKKLEATGYITGYVAQINSAKLGETLTVFTEVTLKNHRRSDFEHFEAAIGKIEACVECHLISGGYDYLLKFITAGVLDYQSIVERLLEDKTVGIDKYFSYIVIKSPFTRSRIPLAKIFGDKMPPFN